MFRNLKKNKKGVLGTNNLQKIIITNKKLTNGFANLILSNNVLGYYYYLLLCVIWTL